MMFAKAKRGSVPTVIRRVPRSKLAEKDLLPAFYDYGAVLEAGRPKGRALKMNRDGSGVQLFPPFDFRTYCCRCQRRRRDIEEIGRELYALRRKYDEKWLNEEETTRERRRFSKLARKFDVPCSCGGRILGFVGRSTETLLLNPTWQLGGCVGYFTHVKYGLW